MARIEPFQAIRPQPRFVQQVAAPPYDVLSSEEARHMARGNPYSFLHVGKPEIDLPEGTPLYNPEVYAKGKENYARLLREGVLFQDRKKNFYVYKQIWGGHTQIGIVAGASCQDYLDGVIKKHELTREDKENDRLRHIETLNAQTGPVFLTYKQRANIDRLVEQETAKGPAYDFATADDVRHVFFVVEDETWIAAIKKEFAALDRLYVADGHHRSAAATRIKVKRQQNNPRHSGDEEYNFFLAVIFPHNQLKILPYNRIVHDLQGLSPAQFLAKIARAFSCEPGAPQPRQSREFSMYLQGRWYWLRPKDGTFPADDPVASLDVSILQNNLLSPILGIANPRTDKRIDFVGGIRGTSELEKKVNNGRYAAAFSLRATTIDQLFAIADANKIMPPKSTWFEPKLKDGLAVHRLD